MRARAGSAGAWNAKTLLSRSSPRWTDCNARMRTWMELRGRAGNSDHVQQKLRGNLFGVY